MHILAALDLTVGKIYRIGRRKRWREFLRLLKALRARWTGEKLYVVLDNFSPDLPGQRSETIHWLPYGAVEWLAVWL
ncbi:hypothetical protein [Streptomyces triculaminicus]|uniref:hypothetical protein n=1 Tax=Streptomyces triculaminicus TaxID=2816232 RepID=UPI003F4D44E0